MIKILVLVFILTLGMSVQILHFEIYKSYANDPHQNNKVSLGVLEVRKNTDYNQVQTSIQPNHPVLVSENDLKQSTVILTFVPKKVKDVEHDNKIYKTAVVQRLSGPQDEIISVIVGIDMKIKAINYMEKRSPLQQIRSEVIKMDAGKQQISKIEIAKKGTSEGGNPEQQSFFAKYKWPIIIGIAVLYLSSMADNKQPAGAAQQK